MKKFASSLVNLWRLFLLGIAFVSFDVDGQTPVFSQCDSAATTFPTATVFDALCAEDTDGNARVTNRVASYTSFCAALNDATLPQMADIKALLQNQNARVTVFAPPDSAFQTFQGPLPTGRDLTRLIQQHIVPRPLLTFDLGCGETVRTLDVIGPSQSSITNCRSASTTAQRGPCNTAANRPIIGEPTNAFYGPSGVIPDPAINLSPGNPWFEVRLDGNFADNIVACNGVIQVVNNVLRPCDSVRGGKKGGKKGGLYYDGYYDSYFGGKKGGKKGGMYYDGYFGGKKGGKKGGFYYDGYYRRTLVEGDDEDTDLEEYDDENADAEEDNEMNEGEEGEERHLKDDIELNVNTDEDNEVKGEDDRQRRLERRKGFLEALVEPNGDITKLN